LQGGRKSGRKIYWYLASSPRARKKGASEIGPSVHCEKGLGPKTNKKKKKAGAAAEPSKGVGKEKKGFRGTASEKTASDPKGKNKS